MDIWINIEINDGVPYPTTHLTEQGALIAQIHSILSFLDCEIGGSPTAGIAEWHNCLSNWGLDDTADLWDENITEWHLKSVDEMRRFRNKVVELTWDAGCVDYCIERTQVEP
jgi:hypothetical protein